MNNEIEVPEDIKVQIIALREQRVGYLDLMSRFSLSKAQVFSVVGSKLKRSPRVIPYVEGLHVHHPKKFQSPELSHIKEKVIEHRKSNKTLPELLELFPNVSKGTMYSWIKDITIEKVHGRNATGKERTENQINASNKWSQQYKTLRNTAYNEGVLEYSELMKNATFRDFLTIFLTEGHRKSKHDVNIANTNPLMIKFIAYWLSKINKNNKKIQLHIQLYKDHDVQKEVVFWQTTSGIDKHRWSYKTNANNLSGRNASLPHGVCSVILYDTYARERMRAWCDLLQKEWNEVSISNA